MRWCCAAPIPVFADSDPWHAQHRLRLTIEALDDATDQRRLFVVHYAGVPCDIDTIDAIANVIACLWSRTRRRHWDLMSTAVALLGRTWACWHVLVPTKPRTSSPAKAACWCVNDSAMVKRAEIIREKGTNRSTFFGAKSTNTAGWISVRRICRPKSSRRFCSPSSSTSMKSTVTGWRPGGSTTRPFWTRDFRLGATAAEFLSMSFTTGISTTC